MVRAVCGVAAPEFERPEASAGLFCQRLALHLAVEPHTNVIA
ncbi:hypothetical protein NODU109028_13770 [Nocardioides dubius]